MTDTPEKTPELQDIIFENTTPCLFKAGDIAYMFMETIGGGPRELPIVHDYSYHVIPAIVDKIFYVPAGRYYMMSLLLNDGTHIIENDGCVFKSVDALHARVFTLATDSLDRARSMADFLDNLKKTYELPDGLPNIENNTPTDTSSVTP